jgi:hypothetical protein
MGIAVPLAYGIVHIIGHLQELLIAHKGVRVFEHMFQLTEVDVGRFGLMFAHWRLQGFRQRTPPTI